VTTLSSTGDVVAVGESPPSNGQANGLVLANNEPAGSTPLAPTPTATPPPGPTPITEMRTLMGVVPDPGKKTHPSA
jgi:hypothetical protein